MPRPLMKVSMAWRFIPYEMKEKLNLTKVLTSKGLKVLNCLAPVLAAHSANVYCGWSYHQLEEPEELKKFRKF